MRITKVFLPMFLIVTILTSLSLAATSDRITGVVSGQSVTLRGNVHRNALPKFDQGPVDPAMRMGTMTLLTRPTASQQKALTRLLAEQQDRTSPNYHKWLKPAQLAERFGLSQHDAQQMAAWLKTQGFTGIHIANARNFVSFNGTAAQVQSAFGTEIHRYNVNGELHYANATAPKVPSAMSGVVTAIRGLHDFLPRPMGIRKHVRPFYDSASFGQIIAPGDVAAIYDIKALYTANIDGSGQELAVMGQTDLYLDNLKDFRTGFGLSSINCTTNGSGVITACNDPHFLYILDPQTADPGVRGGDLSESNLDVEWAGAVAKGAQIVFVNSSDVFTSYYYTIDNDGIAPVPSVSVISLSYGLCELGDEGFVGSDEAELALANSEGITFVNSSGDSGAAECDPNITDQQGISATGGLAVAYPASSQYVTGVGGTAIPYPDGFNAQYWGTTNGSDGGTAQGYVPEVPWNDDAEFAVYCTDTGSCSATTAQEVQSVIGISIGGGGVSNCAATNGNGLCMAGFGQPSWQHVTIAGQAPARFSPDVSFLASANFPGYIFCTTLSELGLAGTTSSCAPGGPAGITNALALTNGANPDPSIIGGTSASAPLFAGIVALLNQSLGTTGLGNVNPLLYSLAAANLTNHAFNQGGAGNNKVYCTAGQPAGQSATLQCPASGVIGFDASTVDAATGYNLVTGLGSVDANNLASAWAATNPVPFTLTPLVSTFQVTQGTPVDATVTVNLDPSFAGTVSFTCSEPAALTESVCTAPASVNASANVSFHITTTAATSAMNRSSDRSGRIFYAALLPGLLGIMFTFGSGKRSFRGMRMLGLIMVLGFSTMWLGSCGGSNNSSQGNPGTPKGNYTITVSGNGNGATQTATFTLSVQ